LGDLPASPFLARHSRSPRRGRAGVCMGSRPPFRAPHPGTGASPGVGLARSPGDAVAPHRRGVERRSPALAERSGRRPVCAQNGSERYPWDRIWHHMATLLEPAREFHRHHFVPFASRTHRVLSAHPGELRGLSSTVDRLHFLDTVRLPLARPSPGAVPLQPMVRDSASAIRRAISHASSLPWTTAFAPAGQMAARPYVPW